MFFQRKRRTILRARCYLKLRKAANNWGNNTLLHSSKKLLHIGQRIKIAGKRDFSGTCDLCIDGVVWIKIPEGVK